MNYNLPSKCGCLLILFLSATLSRLNAQSFTNNTQTTITDNGTVSIPIIVSGLTGPIDTTNFGLESVSVNITHADDKQLTLKLQSPDGKVILLSQKNLGVNYNTTFDAVADTFVDIHFPKEGYIYKGSYSGNYRPRMDLALLNNN